VNKQERTYTILRDRIHTGAYAPEARLNIDALARELGVSAIPIREALRRLEAEGWVQFKANVGAIVSPVDATSWEQAMVTLAVLEGVATAEAQKHLRRADFAKLRSISAEMEKAESLANPMRFSEMNRKLHDTITSRCPNTYLGELLEQTYRRLDRVRSTMFVYLPQRSEEALHEHARLLSLLEDGDKVEVERFARWHKLQTVEAYRAIHHANDQVLAARQERRSIAGVPLT
jgi:DNA-binding GntR family transcriptional regulator